MQDKSHLNPLTQPSKHRKSDEQLPTIQPFNPQSHRQKRSSKCLVYVLLLVVLLSIAFLVLGLVVLRIKTPTLRLSLVAIRDLQYDAASLNTTVVAEIRLHNMNFGRFEFRSGNATLLYDKATIGAATIYDGRIESREKKGMNVTVKVTASNYELSKNYMNISRDINQGLVKLRSCAKLRGEVRAMKIINRQRTAVMNCTMALNLTSKLLQDLSCL
ncbi:hypothetical protein BUALT_Bualt10G0057200 [Buddleja alternifolia]|uniref:Late embryogenesis abundant protein LEA-2 subgroup domain-containing protein n=1 Tax=Buddleja alternifolia TaxID=168488 RepID=A0AAV6X793_9LAMI|nr:hypothetical protein BUALT_Bualt10G0057200 [Buddleja alternifolia]